MMTLLIDGAPATLEDLTHQALTNYGAFTSFRVEGGGVRGLADHIARIEVAAAELFGEPLGEDRLRHLIRQAVVDRSESWVRVSLFSPEIRPRTPSWKGMPKVMTLVSPPPSALAESLRLMTLVHARHLPTIKHNATMDLVHARRVARVAGFDDALFTDVEGLISEGSTWNIGFVKDDRITWPRAPMLAGVTQRLIERGLASVGMRSETRPVHLADLAAFDAAFVCNSTTPACVVTSIGNHRLVGPDRTADLAAAWASNVPDPI